MLRLAKEMKRPYPRHSPERHLEAACPVDAHSRRVLLHPGGEMTGKCLSVTLVTGQPVCHAEREKILMPVQFPDDLLVAGLGGIKLVKLFPMLERRRLGR